MVGRVCWYCKRYANMSFIDGRGTEVDGHFLHIMGVYSCDSCRHLSLAIVRMDARISTPRSGVEEAIEQLPESILWLPPKAVGKEFPDVPDVIASAASEVHQCLSIHANRAAIALARAVVEATAKDNGVTDGVLYAKIEELARRGLIRDHTREAAHEVRLDGNGIAHGDLAAEPPSTEDAEEVVALMDELLAEIYQGPARVRRVRESRALREHVQPPQ